MLFSFLGSLGTTRAYTPKKRQGIALEYQNPQALGRPFRAQFRGKTVGHRQSRNCNQDWVDLDALEESVAARVESDWENVKRDLEKRLPTRSLNKWSQAACRSNAMRTP